MIKRGVDMSINAGSDKIKKGVAALRMAAYLLAVVLVFAVVSFLCTVNAPVAPSPYNGAVNLTGVDFGNEIATIQNTYFTMYPGAFYLPEEFAAGKVTQAGIPYDSPGEVLSDYGTLRILLILPQDEVYAIAGKNVSYAQRLFIDGKEYAPIGVTGDSIETVTPKATRFVESFQPTGDTTEITIQYSAFVYADGGGLYPFVIGYVRNVARNEQLKVFRITAVTAALVTAALFFFGLFLFFPKGRYLLWFALLGVCVALRGLLTSDKFIMLLLPNLDWYLAVRMEFATNCGMALFAALYLNSLFPGVAHRWAMRGFAALCASHLLFISLTPTAYFTRYTAWLVGGYAVFVSCLLLAVLITALGQKLTSPLSDAEQILFLFGLVIYASFSVFGIYGHQNSLSLWGLDYPQVGMIVFLFLNMLALVLGFARTERELDEARRSEREMEETNRMLERLDKLRSDFLANISHEIKTPLTVADGFAQYTLAQIENGSVGEDTKENLRLISKESVRLAELAEGLLRVSADMAWDRRLTSVEEVIKRAAATCRPILAKNNNRLNLRIEDGLPPVRVNENMIHQVMLNLAVNANNHTQGGTVTFSGAVREGAAAFTVSDNGRGINPKLLSEAFKRQVSGGGGTGLGLAICKEIIDLHNGWITIVSTPGAGTTVTFTLPLEKENANATDHTDD